MRLARDALRPQLRNPLRLFLLRGAPLRRRREKALLPRRDRIGVRLHRCVRSHRVRLSRDQPFPTRASQT